VFRLTPSEYLSQNEIDSAQLLRSTEFYSQHQKRISWPADSVVARAYLDQLGRSHGITPARAQAVKSALERADKVRSSRDKGAMAAVDSLNAAAAQLDIDAAGAHTGDAARLHALASTMRARAAALQ
jgi:hypothetical protein